MSPIAKSGVERRTYRRYLLSFKVSLRLADGRDIHGRSLDLCLGGLLFAPDAAGVVLLNTVTPNTPVRLTLHAPERQSLGLTAVTARRTPSGTGVAFTALGQEQLQQIHALLTTQKPQHTQTQEVNHDVLPECEAVFAHQMRTLAGLLSAELSKAAMPDTPAPQKLLASWQAELQQQLKQFWQPRTETNAAASDSEAPSDSLRLLGEAELAAWLAQVSLGQQLEQKHQAALFPLERRLGNLVATRVSATNNPFAPTAILAALVRALKANAWPEDQHQWVLTLVTQHSSESLTTLYAALNQLLERAGIGATPLARKAATRKSVPPTPPAVPPATPPPVSAHSATANLGNAYQHLSSLLAVQTQLHPQQGVNLPAYPHEALVTQLGAWQPTQQAVNALALKDDLLHYLKQTGGSGLNPAPADNATLDLTLTVFQELLTDPGLAPELKHLSRRLIAPLTRLALTDNRFFASAEHPARQMLNALSHAGHGWNHHEGLGAHTLYGQLSRLVEHLGDTQSLTPQSLEHSIQEFLRYLQREQQQRDTNQRRLLANQKGQERLSRAQQAVLQAINPLLTQDGAPMPIWQWLQYAWKDFLVLVYLQHGAEHPEWERSIHLVRQILGLEASDYDTLHDGMLAGLHTIAFDAHRSELLVAQACAAWELPSQYPRELAPISFPSASYERSGDPSCQLASRLQLGDWIEYIAPNGQLVQAQLAWKNPFNLSYLFVNRLGMKVREYGLGDLTELLRQPGSRLLERELLPLVEQAMYTKMDAIATDISVSARHDPLTGLANRKELELRLESLVHNAKTQPHTHAIAYFDLDQFRVINDLCGHAAGDALICEVGILINGLIAKTDLLARIGGDEFALLLADVSLDQAQQAVEAQRQAISAYHFAWQAQTYPVHASFGLVPINAASQSAQVLLSTADAACYAAKQAGRNRIQVQGAEDQAVAFQQSQMQWMPVITTALERNWLQLECQPIAPLIANGHGEHFEVLLRMQDGEGRKLNPGDFLPAAERFQRMAEIDRWVVETVLVWLQQQPSLDWLEGFSINLSGQSLNDNRFLDFLLAQVKQSNLPPEKLCFEATETVAIADFDRTVAAIRTIKDLGCRFSLDDFGSGMSSFAYLRKLPVDYLKIDGMFIKNLDRDPTDFAFVKSIREIAQFMGKKTIAEYVEHEAIATKLREIGVDYAQGYYIGRPQSLQSLARS